MKSRHPAFSMSAFALASLYSIILGAGVSPGSAAGAAVLPGEGLPVRPPTEDGLTEIVGGIENLYSQDLLVACIGDGNEEGLSLDLSSISTLLDGSRVSPDSIYGRAYTGPYPFGSGQSAYTVCQYRKSSSVRSGSCTLPVAGLADPDAEEWARNGRLAVRLDLFLARRGADRNLGSYDVLVNFRLEDGRYRRGVTVLEGPFVAGISSDAPDSLAIVLRTDREVTARVILTEESAAGEARPADPRVVIGEPARIHTIPATGLRPDTWYRYRVEVDGWRSAEHRLRTAPRKGDGNFRFAYAGDSREAAGGGDRARMGVNAYVLERLLSAAHQQEARFWIHGGDLVDGYTTSLADFEAQLRQFKWVASPFLHGRPLYTVMGNHDALVRSFEDSSGSEVELDRWPYGTESSEAVFAREFWNPGNAPAPEDPRRPPYDETVYTLTYGPVRIVVCNNNYWVSYSVEEYGGSPEGWFFDDQLKWIRDRLDEAETDPAIRFVLVVFQEPAFPNGGHLGDAMWHGGDTRVRAASRLTREETVSLEPKGLIEVRNELARMFAARRKVAAVLSADEHNYSRVLIDHRVPVGVPDRDDTDGDGKICGDDEPCSPLDDLQWPVWYVVSGGAGAPHYLHEPAPWNRFWTAGDQEPPDPAGGFSFSALNHWVLFEVDGNRLGIRVLSIAGEEIDAVEDLMAVKHRSR